MDTKELHSDSPSLRTGKARLGGCLFVVLALPFFYYGLYLLFRVPNNSSPQLIAHRGGPAYHPENTLPAFRQAISDGADWIEFDVQRTSDGVLIVIHDETVDRTTNGQGQVALMQFEEIRQLDAGNGAQIPTFEEVLSLAKEAQVGILPEAKSPDLYPGIEDEILSAIVEADYQHVAVVQSFKPDILVKVKVSNPEAKVCPLTGLWVLDLKNPQPTSAQTLCPMAEMVILNPWMIRQAQREGRQVFIWFGVIEHPWVMRLLLNLGADGLMVDDPAAMARVLGK